MKRYIVTGFMMVDNLSDKVSLAVTGKEVHCESQIAAIQTLLDSPDTKAQIIDNRLAIWSYDRLSIWANIKVA